MIENFYFYQSADSNVESALAFHSVVFKKLEEINSLEGLTESAAAFQKDGEKLKLWLLLDGKLSELVFDFIDGEVGFRATRVSKSNEVVAKALGCKPHYRPSVLDATAGMGRDALIMAMLGCKVEMQERNPAIFELLANALERFETQGGARELVGELALSQKNSIENLSQTQMEVIYLDPMFPERKKSALVKKEMRLFKKLAGEDVDADALLLEALKSNAKRVVVKRPKGAPLLAGKKPSHEISAKKFRYDVYLK